MSGDPRATFPIGATLDDGAYTIEARTHGDRFRGLYRGRDRDGRPVLVTVGGKQRRPPAEIAAELGLAFDGVARLRHVGPVSRVRGGDEYDGLVEEAPAGRAVADLSLPLPAQGALALALDVAAVAIRAHAAGAVLLEIRPELVFIGDQGALTGLAPRAERFTSSGARPNFSQPPLFPDQCWSPEVLEGAAPGPAADVFATALLLARIVDGHFPFEGDNRQAQGFAITDGRRRPFTGPAQLAALIDAGLALDPTSRPTMTAWRDQALAAGPGQP